MTYNVLMGTLNPTHSLTHDTVRVCDRLTGRIAVADTAVDSNVQHYAVRMTASK